MNKRTISLGLRVYLLAALYVFAPQTLFSAELAQGERGIVATVHPLATQAGLDAMKRGGNAIDAAVAVALALGVVDGHNSGIGGGCLMLIHLANGQVVAIDGREVAPLAAHRDMYVVNGKPNPQLSQIGPLAIGVPGALSAYNLAVTRYGRSRLADHLNYAARIAEQGFAIDKTYAERLRATAGELAAFEPTRSIFLHADGRVPREGEILKQPDLAKTYRNIATHGIGWFYNGPFATMTEQWMLQNGGILTALDLATYEAVVRNPVTSTYRDYSIIGFPPPSSGGVHVAEILNILENFDLKGMGAGSADSIHVIAEAMKLAFADRAYWMGDSDFVQVPRGLASKPYAAQLAKRINRERATAVPQHSTPPRAQQDFFRRHTTHFSTADAAGNWVSCTATINTSFGSKVVIPTTGVLMNNQMDDFSIQPGVPNYFGLLGSEANAIAARKRPLSSMSPTIVLRDRKPVLALGAAGGPTIISQVVLTIVNMADFSMKLDAAMAQARFHHQWQPDGIRIEGKIGEAVLRELDRRGHRLDVVESLGATQAVGRSPNDTRFFGASDPRVSGSSAAGW